MGMATTSQSTDLLLPFPRDDAFIGREDIFSRIEDVLHHTNHAALVGLGGMGKSQIAIEYAYRCKEQNPKFRIFWVRASRHDRSQKSFQDIAHGLALPGRDDLSVNMITLVKDWLCHQQQDPWLLVYDDADQDVFSSACEEVLQMKSRPDTPCMSRPSQGSILITSRDRTTAIRLAGDTSCIINVDNFTEQEAVNLLKAKLPSDTSSAECIDELARELDYIPLAISQAVSYMGSRLSISDYLLMLRTSEMMRTLLLDYEFCDPRRAYSPSNAILKTLWISFGKVCEVAPSAAGLMSLFSIYHHQGIPNRLVTRGGERSQEWDHVIRTLLDFSVIKQCPLSARFTMHRVVQLSLKEWLKLNGSIEAQHDDIEHLLCRYPGHLTEHEDWHLNVPRTITVVASSE